VRYGFLAEVAQQVDASAVAVGHHADDQTETVLMHFLRGTGLAGLKGMSPKMDLASLRVIRDRSMSSSPGSRIHLVRPLLSVPRAEIEGYCRANHLWPRFDRSNLDMTYLRNRLRHELLPFLETYNPNIRALLRRTADVASADHELLTELRDRAWAESVRGENANGISFDLLGWRALPLALQRAILREAAYRLCPELRDVGYVHIAQAVEIAAGVPPC
jgi:tRNA(Ile)-lysidine synthase TilS/MesJ